MKTPIHKNERVLNLLAYLLQSRSVVPFSQIKQNVEGYNDRRTSNRTINRRFERDKATLRALGIDIVYVEDDGAGGGGYIIPKPAAYMGDIHLSDSEGNLLLALAAGGRRQGGLIHDNLSSACQKLLTMCAVRQTEDPARRMVIRMRKRSTGTSFAANLEILAEAAERRRRVQFTYYSIYRDNSGFRVVEPYGLKFYRGVWYLVGRCLTAGDIRVFRVNRISRRARFASPAATGEFEIPPDFKIQDYVCRNPWELSMERPVTVRVQLDEIGTWLAEEMKPIILYKRGKPKGTVEFKVSNERGLYKWLFTLGAHVRVLSPEGIVVGYREFVRRIRDSWLA
ncbi:MAG: WYL domain-containing protein [Planctomycetes bacterium]|nr:WYL domain-containing protein [Planctomycetota bacterium]